jgi:hypothetical protein
MVVSITELPAGADADEAPEPGSLLPDVAPVLHEASTSVRPAAAARTIFVCMEGSLLLME